MADNLIPSLPQFWRNGGVGNGNYVPGQNGITLAADLFTVSVAPSTAYKLKAFTDGIDYNILAGVHQVDANGMFLNDSGWRWLDLANPDGYTFTTLPNAVGIRLVVRSTDYTAAGRDVLFADMGEGVLLRMSEPPFDDWYPATIESGGGWLYER